MSDFVNQNERARQLWVEKVLSAIPAGRKILDAGAGEQQYKKYCHHLSYTSQDFGNYKPDELENGLHMEKWDYGKLDIVSDITKIPVDDASFDVILCTEVFEHIPDPLAAIAEFGRILKPGGTLIVTAPFCSMTHFAPYHFYSGFNKYYYETVYPLHGLEVVEMTPNGNYFDYMLQETNRLPHLMEEVAAGSLSKFQKWMIARVSSLCSKYAAIPNNTAELMCFGWHVVAKKNK